MNKWVEYDELYRNLRIGWYWAWSHGMKVPYMVSVAYHDDLELQGYEWYQKVEVPNLPYYSETA